MSIIDVSLHTPLNASIGIEIKIMFSPCQCILQVPGRMRIVSPCITTKSSIRRETLSPPAIIIIIELGGLNKDRSGLWWSSITSTLMALSMDEEDQDYTFMSQAGTLTSRTSRTATLMVVITAWKLFQSNAIVLMLTRRQDHLRGPHQGTRNHVESRLTHT